jgi:hypothetical protein
VEDNPKQTTKDQAIMKKLLSVFAVLSLIGFVAAFGADEKKYKAGGCCDKAAKAGTKCEHKCCVSAEKEGKVCAKCNK